MDIRQGSRITLYLAFAVSGFCALVYEILWTKYLSLTFGTTMLAVSIVAATFMGGLALGSFLLGRYADRETNLLRIYAFLEMGIALTALLFPPTLAVVEEIYIFLTQALPRQALITNGIRFFFSAMLLVPPTVFMGGTFPLMCRFFARKKSSAQIGLLYALNTLGATLGALLSGYLLIPTLGLSTTGHFAVFINLAIAVVAFFLAPRIGHTAPHDVSERKRLLQPRSALQHRYVLIAIGLIGFFSLAYEILWTRVFLLFLGNTSYAFSLMLSAFLIGISLGGALYVRLVKLNINEKRLFCLLTLLMGVIILATAPFYDRLAYIFQFAQQVSGERWWHLSLLNFIIVFLTMALPTILSGCLLPAAVAIINPGKVNTGEGVGLVVLANTSGAVLGSLAAGFLLIPTLGLQLSFQTLACLNIGLALFLSYRFWQGMDKRFTRSPLPALFLVGLVLVFLPDPWDPQLMNSGIYIYAPKYSHSGGIDKVLSQEKIIRVIEGIDTTVAIHEGIVDKTRFFTVNGKTDGGTGRDTATQILVSHAPLLLHSNPKDVMVIGLGTGISLKGLSGHPVKHIDCIEISPEVVLASDYFREVNGNALNDSKVQLIIDDGRNRLLTKEKQYDVIISEPSNPWQTGNANLFTADFYRLAARRLKSEGIFCQWVGLYDITTENMRTIIHTFLETFPQGMSFRVGSDLFMVGAKESLRFDYLTMKSRFSSHKVRNTLASIGISSPGDLIAKYYIGDNSALHTFSEGAILNTDDLPLLEFSSRFNLGEKTLGGLQMQNIYALNQALNRVSMPLGNLGSSPTEIAVSLREIAASYAREGRTTEAQQFMREAESISQRMAGPS